MIQLDIGQNSVSVCVDGVAIGTLGLYRNAYHMQNQYLKMDHITLDAQISAELFRKLFDEIGRPLQVMTDSENLPLIDFIVSGGFVCKRKCYEVDKSIYCGRKDIIGLNGTGGISTTVNGIHCESVLNLT